MHQVQLSDQLYQQAARRASEAGFSSVDDYVADVLQNDTGDYTPDDLDSRFTPKVIDALDEASAGVEAGRFFTPEEVDARLDKRREEWLKTHKS